MENERYLSSPSPTEASGCRATSAFDADIRTILCLSKQDRKTMIKYSSENGFTEREDSPVIDIEQQAGGPNSPGELKTHGFRKYAQFQWLKRNRKTSVCLLSSKICRFMLIMIYLSFQENYVLQSPVTQRQNHLVCPILTNRPVHSCLSNILAGRNSTSSSSS
jgi:hypothetical protein